MQLDSLTKLQRKLACEAINKYGTPDHPEATIFTFRFFSPVYVKACVLSARSTGQLSPFVDKLALEIIEAL